MFLRSIAKSKPVVYPTAEELRQDPTLRQRLLLAVGGAVTMGVLQGCGTAKPDSTRVVGDYGPVTATQSATTPTLPNPSVQPEGMLVGDVALRVEPIRKPGECPAVTTPSASIAPVQPPSIPLGGIPPVPNPPVSATTPALPADIPLRGEAPAVSTMSSTTSALPAVKPSKVRLMGISGSAVE